MSLVHRYPNAKYDVLIGHGSTAVNSCTDRDSGLFKTELFKSVKIQTISICSWFQPYIYTARYKDIENKQIGHREIRQYLQREIRNHAQQNSNKGKEYLT